MPMTRTNPPSGAFDERPLPAAFAAPAAGLAGGALPFGASPLEEGATLGDLTLERRLGQGGAGEVWLARNQFTGRKFAVKACFSPGSRSLLANEARALGRLMDAARERDFPDSIVRLLETQLASEPPYLVMEYVEGGDLRQHLLAKGPLAESDATALLERVLGALEYAHALGLTHRDIKPENILLDERGRARVTDFGLGQVVVANTLSIQRSVGGASSAGTPEIGGTVDYMAPEQLRGEPSTPVSDIYSLGVVLYEALTGERPRGLTSPSRRRKGIHPAWDALFERCYAHDPADRFQSMAELRSAAARLLDPATVAAPVELKSDDRPRGRTFSSSFRIRANAKSDESRLARLAVEMTADEKLKAYFGYRFFGWILPAALWNYVAYFAYHHSTSSLVPNLTGEEASFAFMAVAATAWIYSWLLFQFMARWKSWRGGVARSALALGTLVATGAGVFAFIHLFMYAGIVATLLAAGLHTIFLGDARAKLLGRRGLFQRDASVVDAEAA